MLIDAFDILLVEDLATDAILTKRELSRHLLNQIHHVTSAEDALQFIFGSQTALDGVPQNIPGLILLDLYLPKMTGFDVLKALRANLHTRAIPVIVMSSSSEDDDMTDSSDAGADAYIIKPVMFPKFFEAAQSLKLGRWALSQPERAASAAGQQTSTTGSA